MDYSKITPILVEAVKELNSEKEQLKNELFHSLSHTIGKEGTMQIQTVVHGMASLAINSYAAVGGFIFLLFVVTTLFKVIKDSINELWEIKIQENSGVKPQLFSRFFVELHLIL